MFEKLSNTADKLNIETRGIERVLPEERDVESARLVALPFWFAAYTISSGWLYSLGSLQLGLSVKHCLTSGSFGILMGALITGAAATLGAKTGLRQMVVVRFFFGWYFSKVLSIISYVSLCFYIMLDCTAGGVILHVLNTDLYEGGSFNVEIGTGIVCGLALLVSLFGFKYINIWQAVFGLIIFFMLVAALANTKVLYYEDSTVANTSGSSLTFFMLCFSTTARWAAVVSDYEVYCPVDTRWWATLILTTVGVFLPSFLALWLSSGVASTLSDLEQYSPVLYDVRQQYAVNGFGGLIFQTLMDNDQLTYSTMKAGVIGLFFSLLASSTFNFYSAPLALQSLGRPIARIPRWILGVLTFAICFPSALTGKHKLMTFLVRILPMLCYWIVIVFIVMVEEKVLFMHGVRRAFDWSTWDQRPKYAKGIAATFAFCCGVVGAVLGMHQKYYTGPIGNSAGGDVGIWLSIAFSAFAYPPARYLEIRMRRNSYSYE